MYILNKYFKSKLIDNFFLDIYDLRIETIWRRWNYISDCISMHYTYRNASELLSKMPEIHMVPFADI